MSSSRRRAPWSCAPRPVAVSRRHAPRACPVAVGRDVPIAPPRHRRGARLCFPHTPRAAWRPRSPRAHHTSQGGPPRCVHRKSTLEAHFLSVLFFSQIYACQTSCSLVTFSPLSNNPCSGGGIGRHASLRCWSGFRLRVRVPPRAPFYDRMACHSVFFFLCFSEQSI